MKPKLSQRQYLNRAGLHCPLCGKPNVTTVGAGNEKDRENNPDPMTLFMLIRCNSQRCGATWKEVFKMTRYVELKDAEGSPVQ